MMYMKSIQNLLQKKGVRRLEIVRRQMAYNCSHRVTDIAYIVIHDTGNTDRGADANRRFNYFNGGDRGSSADIFVDDHSAWIVNDYIKNYAWHCGDGHGKYGITNGNSVGVEMCINRDGNYGRAFSNTQEIVKMLMDELKIDPDHVVRHYDASRKNCPASMSANGWAKWKEFKEKLKSEDLTMSQYEELNQKIDRLTDAVNRIAEEAAPVVHPMIYNYIDENMPEYARPTIQKLVNKGLLKGSGGGLNLTDDLLRLLVINDGAGLYGE